MNRPRRVDGLAFVDEPARVVVLNLPRVEEQQSPYVFEGTAFDIWSLIDGTRNQGDIVDELDQATDVARAVVARDVAVFLSTLRDLGLVEPAMNGLGDDAGA